MWPLSDIVYIVSQCLLSINSIGIYHSCFQDIMIILFLVLKLLKTKVRCINILNNFSSFHFLPILWYIIFCIHKIFNTIISYHLFYYKKPLWIHNTRTQIKKNFNLKTGIYKYKSESKYPLHSLNYARVFTKGVNKVLVWKKYCLLIKLQEFTFKSFNYNEI